MFAKTAREHCRRTREHRAKVNISKVLCVFVFVDHDVKTERTNITRRQGVYMTVSRKPSAPRPQPNATLETTFLPTGPVYERPALRECGIWFRLLSTDVVATRYCNRLRTLRLQEITAA